MGHRQSQNNIGNEAIEDLRLDSLKPWRLTVWEMSRLSGKKLSRSSKKTTKVKKGQALSKTHSRKRDHRHKLPSKPFRNGVIKSQVALPITPLLPEPPPPRHGSKELSSQGGKILSCVDEERKLAPKPLKSQCTSTSATQAMDWCLQEEAVKKSSWKPPLKLAERKSCGQ